MERDAMGRTFVAARNAWERRRKEKERGANTMQAVSRASNSSARDARRGVMRQFSAGFGRPTPTSPPNNSPSPAPQAMDKMYRPERDGPKRGPR